MFPNLLGQKAYHHMTDDDMAEVIGVSRNAYQQKIRSGRFTPDECKAFCSASASDLNICLQKTMKLTRTEGGEKMDLSVWEKVDHRKVEAVARDIGVPTEVFWGYLIDERAPRSVIVKLAKRFNRPFEYYTKGLYKPPKYTRNREQWEQL